MINPILKDFSINTRFIFSVKEQPNYFTKGSHYEANIVVPSFSYGKWHSFKTFYGLSALDAVSKSLIYISKFN